MTRQFWRSSLMLLVVLAALSPGLALTAPPGGPEQKPVVAQTGRYRTYLPSIWVSDSFGDLPATWVSSSSQSNNEVGLFRYTFTLTQPAEAARLDIFADTRYQAWIDGRPIGRGPARFSRTLHEYDVQSLGNLGAGKHVLAVMVQWAPNKRRSESSLPHLQVRMFAGQTQLRPSPAEWRVLQSNAWNPEATLVHSWDLLGPTELLDLRRLPAAWFQPSFDDNTWQRAVTVTPPKPFFQPRSISALSEVTIPITVRANSVLLPDYWVGELSTTGDGGDAYRFTLSALTTVTIQALKLVGLPDPVSHVTLNNAPLEWSSVVGEPPDLLRAVRTLPAGNYVLQVDGLDTANNSWPFAISRQNITSAPPPLSQGTKPGYRTLLAGPLPTLDPRLPAEQMSTSLVFAETPAYAILDLGRVVHGRVIADVSGPEGTLIDIGWDERLWKGSRPLPTPGSLHPEWNQTDSWVLDGSTRTLTTIDTRSGRYVLIAAWGSGPVRLDNLRIMEERYPVEQRGSFNSSRPLLNQIWQIGVDTLYPNMSDAYADPWRERGQWWGDAHIDDQANSVAFGDTQLLRRGLLLMAQAVRMNNGRPHALAPNGEGNYMLDYGMLWVQSSRDYLVRTGDTDFIKQIYPELRSFLNYLEQQVYPSTGLINLPNSSWSQTAYIDSGSSLDRIGQTTAVNAMYYGTLLDMGALGLASGDNEGATAYRARANLLRDQINRTLYRPERGLYVAAIIDGRETAPSPQAQAIALAYGVPPASEIQRVADALLANLGTPEAPKVQIYGMFWVLEGLGRADRTTEALDLIERFFGSMVQRGATTWWENFQAINSYTQSLSHGWGGSPTWFLSHYVLGIRQDESSKWTIRPQTGHLTRASGEVPFGDNTIGVSWSTADCSQLTLQLTTPEQTTGQMIFPSKGTITMITMDNTVVWADGRSLIGNQASENDNDIAISLGGGIHNFNLQLSCATTLAP